MFTFEKYFWIGLKFKLNLSIKIKEFHRNTRAISFFSSNFILLGLRRLTHISKYSKQFRRKETDWDEIFFLLQFSIWLSCPISSSSFQNVERFQKPECMKNSFHIEFFVLNWHFSFSLIGFYIKSLLWNLVKFSPQLLLNSQTIRQFRFLINL